MKLQTIANNRSSQREHRALGKGYENLRGIMGLGKGWEGAVRRGTDDSLLLKQFQKRYNYC